MDAFGEHEDQHESRQANVPASEVKGEVDSAESPKIWCVVAWYRRCRAAVRCCRPRHDTRGLPWFISV